MWRDSPVSILACYLAGREPDGLITLEGQVGTGLEGIIACKWSRFRPLFARSVSASE